MPFINSKVSVKITPDQEKELKTRLGEKICLCFKRRFDFELFEKSRNRLFSFAIKRGARI